jgi:signal transduction histidine kinase
MESGSFPLNKEVCLSRSLVENAVDLIKSRSREKNIRITVHVDGKIPILCDRQRIETALVNLLDNAVKFSRPGSLVETGAKRSADMATFWVKDLGGGISDEDLPHIFDRFYRSSENRDQGSGLGLSIVKSIVEAHQGRVWVVPVVEGGSVFHFSLPAQPAP